MQLPVRPFLFVAVLVVLAGCSTLSGGSGPVTVTPGEVPTSEPMSAVPTEDGRWGSGQCLADVTDLGFGDVSGLAAAHASSLDDASFTVERSVSGSYRNGSLAYYNFTTVRVGGDHRRMRVFELGMGTGESLSPYRFQQWTDGERVASRELSGPTAAYAVRSRSSSGPDRFRSAVGRATGVPEAVVANATTCVTGQAGDADDTHAIVSFTRPSPPNGVPAGSTVAGTVTGRMLVSSSGLVYDVRWNYTERTADGVVVRHSVSTRITDVGSTTVERPAWYATAANRTETAGSGTDG